MPVTTLQREDLALEGSPTAIDLIKSLSFSQGADGETDQFQAGAGADRATINIRGLGPSRTLVLVNGRRVTWSPHAITAQAQLLVDVNMIPSIALQRVELLRDGAAATYGSDAIAGVANFITRSDFEGFELTANHKEIADSDGDQEWGAIWGASFMDGDAHFVTSASYIKRSELRISDRDWSLLTFPESSRGGWSLVGRPAVFLPYDKWDAIDPTEVTNPFTRVVIGGIVDPNCEDLGGALTSGAGFPGGGFCRFQYTAFDNLIEEAERWQWLTEASFNVGDSSRLSFEFLLGNSDVPNWGTSPSYPPNRLVDRSRSLRANNPGLIDMASKYQDAYGPYASCAEDYCMYEGDPLDEIGWFFGRYYGQDGPPRGHHRESRLARFVMALDTQWGESDFQFSLQYSRSERESAQGDTMAYRDERAREGLGGHDCEATVPNEYNSAGELEFSLETLREHAGKGPCRYWIPFSNAMPGANPLVRNGEAVNPDFNPELSNQLLRDYMITTGVSLGETSLLVAEGILSGELGWELGGGPTSYAAGFQYRYETYQQDQLAGSFYDGDIYPCLAGPDRRDCETGRTGLFNFLPPGFPVDDSRGVWALFGEMRFPFGDSFEAQLSVRHEAYSGDVGSTTDPKVAFRWQMTDSFGVRASFGSTFRGPTLNQIVPSNSANSLQFIAVTGAFKRVDTKGNPDLISEEADTFNVGLLLDRDGLFTSTDNLFVTLDYWSYDFTDPLVTEPFSRVVALACPVAGAPCDENSPYINRLVFGGGRSASAIEIINVDIINGPDYETSGIDFTFRYGIGVGPGYLSTDLSGTKIEAFDIAAWDFEGEYDALGRLNYNTSLARTLAEWKARATINFEWNDLNLRWVTSYIDEYKYEGAPPRVANNPTGRNPDDIVPSHVTHDLHLTYGFMDGRLTANASIINLEDEDPPHMSREFNYDAFTHNPFGRMFRLGFTLSLGAN